LGISSKHGVLGGPFFEKGRLMIDQTSQKVDGMKYHERERELAKGAFKACS
jgi:hypothetical protein